MLLQICTQYLDARLIIGKALIMSIRLDRGLRAFPCPVGNETLSTTPVLPYNHDRFSYAGHLDKASFNLAQLYALPTYLHLKVISTLVLDGPIRTPSSEITRSVHASVCFLTEGIFKKPVPGQIRTAQISTGNTITAYVDLAGNADRYRLPL